jgi:hypothetical protein
MPKPEPKAQTKVANAALYDKSKPSHKDRSNQKQGQNNLAASGAPPSLVNAL